jgi:hypothetical protein
VANIAEADVQAWLEDTKLEVGSLDAKLEEQIASEVLGRISTAAYDVTGWTDSATTPKLVKKIIAMLYAGWYYDRQYSETPDTNEYAIRLKESAESLLMGVVGGTIDIGEVPGTSTFGEPVIFPNDTSSAADVSIEGDGPAAFSMGSRF